MRQTIPLTHQKTCVIDTSTHTFEMWNCIMLLLTALADTLAICCRIFNICMENSVCMYILACVNSWRFLTLDLKFQQQQTHIWINVCVQCTLSSLCVSIMLVGVGKLAGTQENLWSFYGSGMKSVGVWHRWSWSWIFLPFNSLIIELISRWTPWETLYKEQTAAQSILILIITCS